MAITSDAVARLNNLPQELKERAQWIVWRLEKHEGKDDKVPASAHTGITCDITDASSWSSFDHCITVAQTRDFAGVGYCLSTDDPFSFIDLDKTDNPSFVNAQKMIYEVFNSYSELSQSGEGLHIIVRGRVPAGRRRNSVEVYSAGRFMVCTGNVYQALRPIEERQFHLEKLYQELSSHTVNGNVLALTHDAPATEDDRSIYDRACAAQNGDRFASLWRGEYWLVNDEDKGTPYPSNSEGDQALINMLAYYTQNREQIVRMFAMSALGKVPKGQYDERWKRKDYMARCISLAFDRIAPPIDITVITNLLNDAIAKRLHLHATPTTEPIVELKSVYTFPPGLVGELSQFIYDASPYQVPEAALTGALGLMAGICGRAYNVSGTGLNVYLLYLAGTGRGKEAIGSGISKIIATMTPRCPRIGDYRGPERLASGQALTRYLSRQPSFVSIIGEFGLNMAKVSDEKNTNAADASLKAALLNYYNRSGYYDVQAASVYSEKEKNVDPIQSPAMSIIGESTPKTFYSLVDEALVRVGIMPRFDIIEYTGMRPYENENKENAQLSQSTQERLASLVQYTMALQIETERKFVTVLYHPNAVEFLRWLSKHATDQVNKFTDKPHGDLWTRAHLKVLKLAALVSVGMHTSFPTITIEAAEWAFNIVNRQIEQLCARFDSGNVGNSSGSVPFNQQVDIVCNLIMEYAHTPIYILEQKYAANGLKKHWRDMAMINLGYLQMRVGRHSAFSGDRLGPAVALKRVMEQLEEIQCIQTVNTRSDEFRAQVLNVAGMHALKGRTPSLYAIVDHDVIATRAANVKS